MEGELILNAAAAPAVYNEVRAQLQTLKEDNSALVFDYATKEGGKAARSHIYKIRQTKGAVDRVRKTAKQDALDYGRAIDSEAKTITSELDAMIDQHERPLKEIEEREAARIDNHKANLASISAFLERTEDENGNTISANRLRVLIDELHSIKIDTSWEEYENQAKELKLTIYRALTGKRTARLQYEAEQLELERLRKEAEQRDAAARAEDEQCKRKEREEQLRREGEERERKAAEKRAAKEKADAERREAELMAAKERAEREAAEAKERAERAKKEAIAAEQLRVENERKREEYERARREADLKHRKNINGLAVNALVKYGIQESTAMAVIELIASGQVPSVLIRY